MDQLVHENTIIYRFDPNELRKIGGITYLNSKGQNLTWSEERRQMSMLVHDQEPLGLDTYDEFTVDDLGNLLKNTIPGFFKFRNQLYQEYKNYKPMICNFIWLSVYDKMLLTHSELNSPILKEYEQLGALGIYWWSHALIARDWYRYAKIDNLLNFSNKNYYFDFNVYNRAWDGTREYRLKFIDLVLQKNFSDYCKIKFSPKINSTHYTQHLFKNNRFRPELNLEVLPSNTASPCSSADYSSLDYNECAIDVVLETLFDDCRHHLTEKILRPIACGKPFILVSTPNSLEYLKNYGFNTFSTVIDESYDSIQDPIERLLAITDLMKYISGLPKEKKDEMFFKMHQIAKKNKEKFWSEEFAEKIINEFLTNYNSARVEMQKYKQGKNWIEIRKKIRVWEPGFDWNKESLPRTRTDILLLHKELYYNRNLFNS